MSTTGRSVRCQRVGTVGAVGAVLAAIAVVAISLALWRHRMIALNQRALVQQSYK